jgi:hypothetical protein
VYVGSSEYPTAVQAEAEVHETPSRKLSRAPLGFGVVWTAHADPFQTSASVVVLPAPVSE